MDNNCTVCGKKLDGKFKFCPDCGSEIKVEVKPKTKQKKQTKKTMKINWPKISLKIPKKTAITVVSVICIIALAAAAVVYIAPFDTTGSIVSSTGGRTFSVSIENTADGAAVCFLKVGKLKYGESFDVLPSETVTVEINEDSLFLQQGQYDVTLYATIDYTEESTVSGVTDSAEFVIGEEQGECFIEALGAR